MEDFALSLGRWVKKFGLYPLKQGTQTRESLLEPFCGPKDWAKHLRWPRQQDDNSDKMFAMFRLRMIEAVKNSSCFVTEKWYIGLGPRDGMRSGDRICIVPGCTVPLVVRRLGSTYELVGDCYVYGIMEGEVMREVTDGKMNESIVFR